MSHVVNNLALTLSEIPLKTFVKETQNQSVFETKKKKFSLGFEGIEAKLAYEKIISIESKKKSLPQNPGIIPQQNKTLEKSTNDNTNNDILMSINKLFKGVELGDKKFVFKYFHSNNVNISDQFGWTPLMSAAYSGHIEIVEYFLNLGASIKAQDKSGFAAIDLAVKKNHTEIVNLIKQQLYKSKKKTCMDNNVSNKKADQNLTDQTKQEIFYCDICKINITESSQKKHESSTLHIFNTHPKVKNAYYGIPKGNKGYQMLLNRGWDEEGGLGPSGEGHKYPVKTVLKRDRKGLGQNSEKAKAKVTHFNPKDIDAIKHVHHNRRKAFTKRDRKRQLDRDAVKTRALREALS